MTRTRASDWTAKHASRSTAGQLGCKARRLSLASGGQTSQCRTVELCPVVSLSTDPPSLSGECRVGPTGLSGWAPAIISMKVQGDQAACVVSKLLAPGRRAAQFVAGYGVLAESIRLRPNEGPATGKAKLPLFPKRREEETRPAAKRRDQPLNGPGVAVSCICHILGWRRAGRVGGGRLADRCGSTIPIHLIFFNPPFSAISKGEIWNASRGRNIIKFREP